jgi:F0F1-type ATP synthase assembly protein I
VADPRGGPPRAPGVGELLQIGVMCGVSIGLGVLAGYLLDSVLGTTPLLVFLGLAVGILGAGVGSYQVIRPFVTDSPDREVGNQPNVKD